MLVVYAATDVTLVVNVTVLFFRFSSYAFQMVLNSEVVIFQDIQQSPKNPINHKKEQKPLLQGTSSRHGKSPCSR